MARFNEKTILIAGGASGIGAATASAFLKEGASVFVADLDELAVKKSQENFTSGGKLAGRFSAHRVDVTDRDQVDQFVAVIEAQGNGLHVLVNCAGIREITPMLELDPAEWRRVIAVNLDGTFHMSQAFAQAVVRGGGTASIVNIASVAGLMGVPNRAAYVAAKHGVVGLTKEMAMELGAHGIRVNAIAPGSVRTPLTERYFDDPELVERLKQSHPLGRVAMPEEIASAILYIASEDAGFVTGAILPVDGGYAAGKAW